eukprot:7391847-Prymnesium_polylepis.1
MSQINISAEAPRGLIVGHSRARPAALRVESCYGALLRAARRRLARLAGHALHLTGSGLLEARVARKALAASGRWLVHALGTRVALSGSRQTRCLPGSASHAQARSSFRLMVTRIARKALAAARRRL